MQFRVDKKSGNKLSVLGFGCMRFPKSLGVIDMQKTESLIMDAIHGGVNYFDTAYIYTGSEEALGAVLEKNQVRQWVFVATKLPLLLVNEPEDFERFFHKQLERLRTGYIDYYLMHNLTDTDRWEQLRQWGIEAWIAEKKRAGQIKRLGFSFHGSQTEFMKLLEVYPWEFCQIQYNYAGKNFQAGFAGLKKAAELMPVMIMEPLLGGKLAANLPRGAIEVLKNADPNLSPAAWGLRWVWDHREVTLLLSGMNDKAQLADNLRTADTALPAMLGEAEHETYKKVLGLFNAAYKIRCTGCNYCMPCPRGINIPGCFAAYNNSFSLGYLSGMQQYLTSTAALVSKKTGGPSLCVRCGRCEKQCPQHLPIIKTLEAARKRMEPFWFKWVIAAARAFLRRRKKNVRVKKKRKQPPAVL
ncbi:MAG: aldo/keto reductase [Spirochaetaceae bacterium]|jgi:predicted aldo/keto reductase-like oxidoreductase|nr:aldo/keto reductase [Spirochaetaceae bacterium]